MHKDCSSLSTLGRRLHVVLINIWRVVNAKGGAERVFCDMANALSRQGFEVSAICFDRNKGLPGYPLDSPVQFINAHEGIRKTFCDRKFLVKIRCWSLSREQREINRFVEKFLKQRRGLETALGCLNDVDVFISFQTETTFILRELLKIKLPIVTMLHGNPSCYWGYPSFRFYKKAIEESSVVQVLRPEFVAEARQYVKKVPIIVIPNVAPKYTESASLQRKKIINVARLDLQKDPELLVRAFSLLKDVFPDWICEWWGETSVNPSLTNHIKELILREGLEDRFLLKGTTNDVPSELLNASIFAFPSVFEGFPIALAEAFAMGLPAVGRNDCPSVNTLIQDGRNGFLTDPTPEAFAKGLSRLMESEELRLRLGTQGKKDMKAYSADCVWGAWTKLICELAHKNQLCKTQS